MKTQEERSATHSGTASAKLSAHETTEPSARSDGRAVSRIYQLILAESNRNQQLHCGSSRGGPLGEASAIRKGTKRK